jgi:hypothetical protein
MTEKTHVWPLLRDGLPMVHWARIENAVATGMADVNGCYKGQEVWIENKIFIGRRLKFRPTQPAWLMNRAKHGGNVFVLARSGDTLFLYDAKDIIHWEHTVLADGDVSMMPTTSEVRKFPKPFDYPMIRQYMFGR